MTHLIHPGEIIKDAVIERNITPYRMAKETGLSQSAVTLLVNAKRSITAEIALRVGKYLSVDPQMLVNLQSHYDCILPLIIGLNALTTNLRKGRVNL